ncbi:MAG TPA: hypothetical protein VEV19_02830 [Ktedonobacteraceae bacterium]|nr:hypothetical protein [Ktedonobacteraceae bacterium]
MDNFEDTQPEHTEDDAPVEFIDLETTSLQDKPPFLNRKRVRFLTTSGIVLLAIILVLILSLSGNLSLLLASLHLPSSSKPVSSSRPTTPLPAPPAPQQDGIACLIDTAWSPDSTRFAVLGYSQHCPLAEYTYEPGLINLYDARSTKRIEQVRPDAAILSALRGHFSQAHDTFNILYDSILWSPDGQQMVVTFSAFSSDRPASTGLFLTPAHGKPKVLLWQTQQVAPFTFYLIWDLAQGKPTMQIYGHENGSFLQNGITIAPAPAYHWNANGSLTLEEQAVTVHSTTSACGPIGNPSGDTTFTPWQPGQAAYVTQLPTGPAHTPGIYVWNTSFVAWSPDGRYLADKLSTSGLLVLPGQAPPSQQTLVDLGADQLSMLPMRDRVIKTILDRPSPDSSSGIFSWRPDGRVLAIYGGANVLLYDCATGQKIASLIPHGGVPIGLEGNGNILRWSPDGSHLLLSSMTWGIISLWGPGQLPGRFAK